MIRFALVFLLLFAVPLSAQPQYSYSKIVAEVTVSGTAAAVFSASDIQAGSGHVQATIATCSVTGANIRVTWDGTTPTSTLGVILVPGNWTFQGTNTLLNLQAIRDDSTSATVNCTVQG